MFEARKVLAWVFFFFGKTPAARSLSALDADSWIRDHVPVNAQSYLLLRLETLRMQLVSQGPGVMQHDKCPQ